MSKPKFDPRQNLTGRAIKRGPMQVAGCTRACSLNAQNVPAGTFPMIHGWFEEGVNNPTIIERAKAIGLKLSHGAISRHKAAHLHPLNLGIDNDVPEEPKTDLQVIEQVIQRGAAQVGMANTKVTTEQLLRAIELKLKLTAGSVFADMYAAMEGDLGPDDAELEDIDPDAGPEMPGAIRAAEEVAQEGLG